MTPSCRISSEKSLTLLFSKMTSQTYDPQTERKYIAFKKKLPLSNVKTVASPHCRTNTKHHKNNVHNFGPQQTVTTDHLLNSCQQPENCL
jgi:hypothetical protein